MANLSSRSGDFRRYLDYCNTKMRIGNRQVIETHEFICPKDETVSLPLRVGSTTVQIEFKFALDQETKGKATMQVVLKPDKTVVVTFTNWQSPFGVMTPYAANLVEVNNKLITLAASGNSVVDHHHVFVQFMMEGDDVTS